MVIKNSKISDDETSIFKQNPKWIKFMMCFIGFGMLNMTLCGCTATIKQTAKTSFEKSAIGSTRLREKDGMEMVFVPEGDFLMGDDQYDDNAKPEHEVYLTAYWMDKYEITNQQYKLCVEAGACTAPFTMSEVNQNENYGNDNYLNYPVININWFQANEYCDWVGGSLPTEAQWEKAARGTDGRSFPWGEEAPNCSLSNYYRDCFGDMVPVGGYPDGASPYGALDMLGNVLEWVMDWYQFGYEVNNDQEGSVWPPKETAHVIRGSYWGNYSDGPKIMSRFYVYPSTNWHFLGFRCVFPVTD